MGQAMLLQQQEQKARKQQRKRKRKREEKEEELVLEKEIIKDEYTQSRSSIYEGCAFVAVDEISDTNVLCTAWPSVIDDCSKDGDKDNKDNDKDGNKDKDGDKDKDKDGDKDKTKNKDNEDGNDTDDTAELIAVARKRKMAKHSNKKNNVLEENKTLPEEIEDILETKMQDKNQEEEQERNIR